MISIVIPAYNEEQRITATLEKVLAHMRAERWQAEIVVVNDGSRDATAAIVREFMSRHAEVRLVENPGNRGKGYSVRHGMMEARGELLLLSDADLSSPIYEAAKLFRAIAQGADVAIGSRWLQAQSQTLRQPWYRQVMGRVYNLLLRLLLGLPHRDTQCGFKAFTRRAALSVFPPQKIERWGFDPEILFLCRRLGFEVAEVPVEWADDNRSRISPIRDSIRMFVEMLRVRWYAMSGAYSALKAVEAESPKVMAASASAGNTAKP